MTDFLFMMRKIHRNSGLQASLSFRAPTRNLAYNVDKSNKNEKVINNWPIEKNAIIH